MSWTKVKSQKRNLKSMLLCAVSTEDVDIEDEDTEDEDT